MDQTIQTFYNEIGKSECTNEEAQKLLEMLNPNDPNYEIIISGIIEKLKKEKEDIEKEYPEMKEYIDELDQKIELCQEKLKKDEEKKQINIIFGKSPSGKVCFLSDLKDIDRERYSSIWKELNRFINSDYHYDGWIEECDVLKIKSPSKGKQERIYGYVLPGGTAYIIGATVKKDDWSKGDRDFVENRVNLVDKDYRKVQNLAKEGNIDDLLEENQEVFETIKGIIKPKVKEPEEIIVNEYEEIVEPTPLEELEAIVMQFDRENENRKQIILKIKNLKRIQITDPEKQKEFDEKINIIKEKAQLMLDEKKKEVRKK